MEKLSKKICMNLKQEKLLPENFDFGKYLGEGGYGKVYHARKKTGYDVGTICAMKVYIVDVYLSIH
jgi:serine/threonine protein kinase